MSRLLIAVFGVFFSIVGVQAQIATSVRVDKDAGVFGPLFVTTGGGEQKVAD